MLFLSPWPLISFSVQLYLREDILLATFERFLDFFQKLKQETYLSLYVQSINRVVIKAYAFLSFLDRLELA